MDDTTKAVAALREVAAAEEPLDDVLTRVATAAAQAIPDAEAATITVLTSGEPRTVAIAEELILAIDNAQYAAGRGPSLRAATVRRSVRSTASGDGLRWPEFVAAARQAGIRACVSVPLLSASDTASPRRGEDRESLGALNVYSLSATAFDPLDEQLTWVFTTAASHALRETRRWQRARDQVANLRTALSTGADIEQARGALMAVHSCTADEAFVRLVEHSRHQNVMLHEIARRFLLFLQQQRSG
ncbi:GAF and ANTAR domain-containing protein [Amycolatopsis sp. YIM 10]|uniref:GAF and ANTAR domain-containing protein n=1 Tax=Amycolatopsis sp. YIM 10 TaxID=2653857 RepID=UPI001D15A961|nr:GAF and ANTAR domain-containing protein [Amycolatopsis sp. YIM 10]